MACGRPAEAGHAADVACGRAGVRTWRAAARADAQAAEVSLTEIRYNGRDCSVTRFLFCFFLQSSSNLVLKQAKLTS